MPKKIERKRKVPNAITNVKSNKSKADFQDRQLDKYRLREEQALRVQKNNELKSLEHQVTNIYMCVCVSV